ncbi:MAG: F0F1 ATP synthase subunit A [Chloroflexota bacterium]|nr:MAG: F0F1 ATP synthase subunit A [Chloroflexota bacterium]
MEKPPRKWRYGINRWVILALVILNIFFVYYVYYPVLPHIQLPAENVSEVPLFGDFFLTNTMVATVIADVILILIAIAVSRAVRSGELIPKGIPGAIEAILEVINNLTESTAGKWAKSIFPYFATITLLVLIVNWMELIPGVDSIGRLEHADHGHQVEEVIPGSNIWTILSERDAGEHAEHNGGYNLVPYVRVASTDLNFTVALALISVLMTQVMGVRALGATYFTKFINVGGIFKRPIFGFIDFFVGLLELLSELSKLLSFSFRLFGNIFAGTVLLFVIGTLIPVFVQSLFLGLEFFVGLIQAVVFGMLTMVFMAQATQGHGEHHEEEEAHA